MANLIQTTNKYDDNGSLYTSGNGINLISGIFLSKTIGGGINQTGSTSNAYIEGDANYFNLDWTSNGLSDAAEFIFDLGEKLTIKNIILDCAPTGTQATTYTIKIQGSEDNISYTDLDTETGSKGAGITIPLTLSSGKVNYRYIKFYFNSQQTASATDSGINVYFTGVYL